MDVITKNIYDDIIELSDLNLQRKLWLNEKNDTGLISSHVEVMCRLFDDYQFDDFVDKASSEVGLSENTIRELKKLRGLLNNYNEKESDEEIINDPEWGKIAEQAKMVLKEWNKA